MANNYSREMVNAMEMVKWVAAVFIAAVIGYLGKAFTKVCMEKFWHRKQAFDVRGETSRGEFEQEKLKSMEKLEKKRLKLEKKRMKKESKKVE